MRAQTITMLTKAWYGDEELTCTFPANWQVSLNKMRGHDEPVMSEADIIAALCAPVGAAPLRELAAGKQKACILFDDLARPTPTHRIVPFVLEELHAAGLTDSQIVFVCAPGSHGPMTREQTAKKLGGVSGRFRVFNHNPYENFTEAGTTRGGTPVRINREVMSCDLKIGVSCLLPHLGAGFGGGAKLILPGVSSIETIYHNHFNVGQHDLKKIDFTGKLGRVKGNPLREDIEEVAALMGYDFSINVLINGAREAVGIHAGHFIEAHRAACRVARDLYETEMAEGCDVVVANAYPIDSQVIKGVWPCTMSLKEGGTAVIVANNAEGEITHYLRGRFGSDYGGRGYRGPAGNPLPQARKILLYNEYPDLLQSDRFGGGDHLQPCTSWAEVLAELVPHHGEGTRVAVYPNASCQVPPLTTS